MQVSIIEGLGRKYSYSFVFSKSIPFTNENKQQALLQLVGFLLTNSTFEQKVCSFLEDIQ